MEKLEKYFIHICGIWFSLNDKGYEWVLKKNDENSSALEKVIKQIERIIDDLKLNPEKWQNGRLDEKAILNRFADSNFFDLEYQHFNDDYDFYIEIVLIKEQIKIRVFKKETIERTIKDTKFVLSDERITEITEN